MRSDALYLYDILEAADAVGRFIRGITQAQFLADELTQCAVLQKLTVIGEAAARISDELRGLHNEVPWSDVIGFRNIAVHAYFRVDWSLVWTTASQDVPQVQIQIRKIVSIGESP